MTRMIPACLLAAAAMLVLPIPASAHAYPQTATPPMNGMVQTAPTHIDIEFDDELEPRFCSIVVTDKAGHRLDAGAARIASGDPKHLSVAVKPLATGTYTVHWKATDTDTHKTEGRYTFMVMQ